MEVILIDVSLGVEIEWALHLTVLVDDFLHLAILHEWREDSMPVKIMMTKICFVEK